jgi:hypothetical protein
MNIKASQIYNGNPWTVAGVKQAIASYEARAEELEKSSNPRDLETARINRREAQWCKDFLAARPNAV